MGQLTTTATVKTYLGETGTTDDALIGILIDRASEFVESFCNRRFGEASYTEYHDGDGIASILFLKQYPVITFTSLHDDPSRAYGSGTLVDTGDYVVTKETGVITLDGLRFDNGVANIKAVYDAGYKLPEAPPGNGGPFPKDLEQACIELVALKYYDRGRERLGKASRTLRDGGMDSYIQDIPWQVRQVLERYRKMRI